MKLTLPLPVVLYGVDHSGQASQFPQFLYEFGYRKDELVIVDSFELLKNTLPNLMPNLLFHQVEQPADALQLFLIRKYSPELHIIAILKPEASTSLLLQSIHSGADTYIIDDDQMRQSMLSIALRGGAFLNTSFALYLFNQIQHGHIPASSLQPAEHELLEQFTRHSPTKICEQYSLSEYQLYARVRQLYRKLHLSFLEE